MNFKLNPKKSLEPYLPYAIAIFIAFAVADLVILSQRDLLLPGEAPPKKTPPQLADNFLTRPAYNTTLDRNIFSKNGEMPPVLKADAGPEDSQTVEEDLPPVPSSLPLTLVGTIVHSNPERSIANIEVKSKNQVLPFSVGREIEGQAQIYAIERTRVFFKNLNTNRREFIEMKLGEVKFTLAGAPQTSQVSIQPSSSVAQVAPNTFEIKRSDLNRYLSDISNVLQQASMIPEKNPDGTIKCFKFVAIQPGSIFTQLGMQNGDCLNEVNGQVVNSIPKAMELFNSLRNNADSVNIGFNRNGQPSSSTYNIK